MIETLLDPVILFFAVGISAGLLKSDIRLPGSTYEFLSIYLLLAIGLKGGIELSHTSFSEIIVPSAFTIALGLIIPVVAFFILAYPGKFAKVDAAAIAGHYGSVSAVTFAVVLGFLDNLHVKYEEHSTVLLVLLEIPAIAIGIFLGKLHSSSGFKMKTLMHEVFLGKSIFLLIGGLIVGFFASQKGMLAIKPLFVDLFKGFLAFFLLEMGIITSRRFADLKKAGVFLVIFGIAMPVISSFLGILAGYLSGMSEGGTVVLATMAASASYIAAPTAMRIALPEANPTFYLTAALGITFPFNIIFGIQFYYWMTGTIFTYLNQIF